MQHRVSFEFQPIRTGLATLCLTVGLLAITACEPAGDTRVARWPLQVFQGEDRKEKLTWLSKGERVELLGVEDEMSKVRLAGGKEGFVESKHLFIQAAVFSDREATLYRRPSASSGEAAGNGNLQPGNVIFIRGYEENEEGRWMQVEGNQSPKYFTGWLKADVAHDLDLAAVQDGLVLETAVRKKDRSALEELAGKSGVIGEAAAATLVELGGLGDEDADNGEAGDNAGGDDDQPATDGDSSSDDLPPPPSGPSGGPGALNGDQAQNPGRKPAPPPPPASL